MLPPLDLNNALFQAAREGDRDKVSSLVEAGADVNAKGKNGITPVIQVDPKCLPVMEYLIAQGADVNYTGFSEGSVLMLAAHAGEAEIVKRLIALGADVNLSMPLRGETALHQACQAGRTETARLLLANGANPNAYTVAGASTEMYCGPLRGETALHFAAAYGDVELVEVLLAAGADKTIPDHYGDRPSIYLRRHQRKAAHFRPMWDLLK